MQQQQEACPAQHLPLHLLPQQQHGCRWTLSPAAGAAMQHPHPRPPQLLCELLLQLQQ
jgi:hypothetical protein